MRKELRDRVLAFNRERAAERETAAELRTLLGKIPPGIMKQLLRNGECAAILEKYGFITEG